MSIWTEYFTTPVPVRAYLGRDSKGDPSFSDTKTAMCRVEYKRANVINADGEQVTSEIKLYSAQPIPAGSMVTIKGIEGPILSYSEATGLDGEIDHYVSRC